ncbi:VOC family protein [Nostocoides sp. HKS02]|uniref:VOC family protein n=1 Tax=Nostocoides sp. HKS02 TaxID=1813880 RepID=UPI0012B49D54|nr:VOC family protein [Tetrasphaera sp. HKS02]QGN58349.1 VOC family protein [Tetrasphaera sp. HKS02]
MTTKTSYAQGTPCWVDLQTSDQDAARAFYAGVLGWEFVEQPMPDGPVYAMAQLGGRNAAAIAPQNPDQAAAGVPAMWNTYLAVDDVDATTARVADAGGTVAMEPFDVMDAGRMSFVADPSGAFVGLWQAREHIGAQVANEPGALTWNELVTTDPESALPFYEKLLGVQAVTVPMGPDYAYTMFQVGDQQVGGSTAPQMPGVPNHWAVWFSVDSADASAARITELGGSLLVEPTDMPVGRMVVARDPQGAVFNLLQPADQTAEAAAEQPTA